MRFLDKRKILKFGPLPKTAIGRAIYRYRQLHSLTQRAFSELADMKTNDISRFEVSAISSPREDTIERLARAMNMETSSLLEQLMKDGYGQEHFKKVRKKRTDFESES